MSTTMAEPTTVAAKPAGSSSLTSAEARTIAVEAYLYLYPLVLMDLTRKQFINMDPKQRGFGGPMNSFSHVRTYPTADMRSVVRPNFDTLYSSAWLDLTGGPVIVSTAGTEGRYFMLPMLDMWTDVFAVPGKRTNGTDAASFAVVPPGWQGRLPENVERIDAPTPYVWIIGRTQTNGVSDYEAVRHIQDGFTITLLADWGKTPKQPEHKMDPSVDVSTEPVRIVNHMKAVDYFKYAMDLLKVNRPHITDWSIVARIKRIGLQAGQSIDKLALGDSELEDVKTTAQRLISEKRATVARITNGWSISTDTMGVYGNYYLKRAVIAQFGLGANQVEDAIYPLIVFDADGKPVTGENNYVLHFDKSQLPPVDAFWSLTMYDGEGFQIANPMNRFAIGDRDEIKYNADGSLDIYIQHKSPGAEKESNWLPAPASGELGLTLRLYAPKAEVANGLWNPPAIKRVS